jgi:hypothetical protein
MASFGEPVMFIPARGVSSPINAVFTERYAESKFVGGDEIVDVKTMLGCQASQFPAALPLQNDRMSIRGRLWRITKVIEDGHGHIDCYLVLANNAAVTAPETPPDYANA